MKFILTFITTKVCGKCAAFWFSETTSLWASHTLKTQTTLTTLGPTGLARSTFHYNSGDPHLLAASIQNQVGMPLDEWADEELFSPIGFSNYHWLRYDGYSYGGWGISSTPREMAKVA